MDAFTFADTATGQGGALGGGGAAVGSDGQVTAGDG